MVDTARITDLTREAEKTGGILEDGVYPDMPSFSRHLVSVAEEAVGLRAAAIEPRC